MNNIGILDPNGNNPNPLSGNPYSDNYKKLAQVWSKFPAYENAESIIKNIINHQVILIISGTGSGKTVLVPKYVLHAFDYKKNIAITLPKQIITKSAAEYAAKTLDVDLGDEVGYQYKGSDRSGKSSNNKLLYATDGTIVAKLLKDPLLLDFNAVVIDEAHERKVQIDFLLYLLKNTVQNRPEFKLIIMSATVNEDIFKSYFATEKFITINIGAKTNYPIESIFLNKSIDSRDPKEYLNKGYEIMKSIIKKDDLKKAQSHDILFFITSVSEAIKICDRISKDPELNAENMCIEVYAGMNAEKQELAQDKDLYKTKFNKKRKIVLATNVAESSLTIDGIKYVIDSGLELSGVYDPVYNCKVLDRKLITNAQARQRMGRAGRTESGTCYHLYTKDDFNNNMIKFPEPTIRTSNIVSESLKFLAIPEINTFNNLLTSYTKFIEPPKEIYIRACFKQLTKLNFIDNNNNNSITKLGLIINDLSLDPQLSLACYVAKRLRCLNEVSSICFCLEQSKYNINELFKSPAELKNNNNNNNNNILRKKFEAAREKHNSKFGDLTSILKIFIEVYKRFDDKNHYNAYIHDNFLNYGNWTKVCNNYENNLRQLRHTLKGIPELPQELTELEIAVRIVACFYYAYADNRIKLNNSNKYTNASIDLNNITLSENSYNYDNNKNMPKELFYIELLKNFGKFEVNITCKITETIEKIYSVLSKSI